MGLELTPGSMKGLAGRCHEADAFEVSAEELNEYEKRFIGKNECPDIAARQMPCSRFFEYPDPEMSDEFKQYWFRLRMENIKQLNCTCQIEVQDSFQENARKYKIKE